MIRFKKIPLFGPDSSPQNTSNILSLAGTALFWLIFLICMIFIKLPAKKPKYKEVQIVLSSQSVNENVRAKKKMEEVKSDLAEKSPVMPEPATEVKSSPVEKTPEPEPVTPPSPTPAPEKQTPAPVAKSPSPKTQPATPAKSVTPAPQPVTPAKSTPPATQPKSPAPATKTPATPQPKSQPAQATPAAPLELAVDPMEAFARQTAQKQKKQFDWSQFDDSSATSESSNEAGNVNPSANASANSQPIKNNLPAFEGSAAIADTGSNQKVTSSSNTTNSAKNRQNKNQTASSATSSALGKIAKQSYTANSANGVESSTNVKSATSDSGKVLIEMSNGSSRALLEPAKPVINLSEVASATIDGSRTVKISFKVVEGGNVPRTSITITPEAILSEIVRNEIVDQISTWRFESADYTANAEFEYKIVKW